MCYNIELQSPAKVFFFPVLFARKIKKRVDMLSNRPNLLSFFTVREEQSQAQQITACLNISKKCQKYSIQIKH